MSDLTPHVRIAWDVEGDRYWARNRARLIDLEHARHDPVLALMGKHSLRPRCVLEVGCANGWRLSAIRARYGSSCWGVDTSPAAIRDGQDLYPRIQGGTSLDLRVGEATLLLTLGREFDCVLLPFVLHWVERDDLSRVVWQVDRVLLPGGHLLIADFLPGEPTKVRYHHRPDIEAYTYKQDYAACWTALGTYVEVARAIFNHDTGEEGDAPPHQRAACVLLQKQEAYRCE